MAGSNLIHNGLRGDLVKSGSLKKGEMLHYYYIETNALTLL